MSAPTPPPAREVLDRTILLLRDDVREDAPDEVLLRALTGATLTLSVDAESLRIPGVQLCVLTATMLAVRSGAKVWIAAGDCALADSVMAMPLFRGSTLSEAIADLGECILPSGRAALGEPDTESDLVVVLGSGGCGVEGARVLHGGAHGWTARLGEVAHEFAPALGDDTNPFGWLALAALVAAELHKAVLTRLLPYARNEEALLGRAQYEVDQVVTLAPEITPVPTSLGEFDLVSGGAITGALLYCLSAIPTVSGGGRVIEPESFDGPNLNRYAPLRSEMVGQPKAAGLAMQFQRLLQRGVLAERFEVGQEVDLASRVLVGVDHIPSRWSVQDADPEWLGIGATSHYDLQVTEHPLGWPCARCLHPHDDDGNALLPTIAFVSFWAGLLLAVRFLRVVAGAGAQPTEQSLYASGLRLGGRVMINPGVRQPACRC